MQSAYRTESVPTPSRAYQPVRTDEDELIIGDSDAMRYVMSRVEQVAADRRHGSAAAARPAPGKELLARAIHRRSPRRDRSVRRRQLRGDAGRAHRERAVRPRARRVHRRARDADRPVRAGQPRHDLPRRDRRAAARSCSRSCSACCRRVRSNGSAARGRSTSTCASSPRPTAICPRKSRQGGFGATCSTG